MNAEKDEMEVVDPGVEATDVVTAAVEGRKADGTEIRPAGTVESKKEAVKNSVTAHGRPLVD